MSDHSADYDAAQIEGHYCLTCASYQCDHAHASYACESDERKQLAEKWANHFGHDGTIHAEIHSGCRFGSPLRDDCCQPRVTLAEAWDKGYKTGYSYRGPYGEGAGNPVPANPYTVITSEGGDS